MRGIVPVPVVVTSSRDWRVSREGGRLAVVLAGAAAGYGWDCGRPVTGGTARQLAAP